MSVKEEWRSRPPSQQEFFALMELEFSPKDFERIRFAYFVSKSGHQGQLRDDGTRYFDHPKAAAWIYFVELDGKDPQVIILLLLHDISEVVSMLSPYRIKLNFGKMTACEVAALTKMPKEAGETIEEYFARIIAAGARAILGKLIDRLHNLRTLYACTEEKRLRQIEETYSYHLPILVPALEKCGKPWSGYAKLLKEKILEAIAAYEED